MVKYVGLLLKSRLSGTLTHAFHLGHASCALLRARGVCPWGVPLPSEPFAAVLARVWQLENGSSGHTNCVGVYKASET